MNRDILQPHLFDAALITHAEIDAGCPAHVCGKATNEKVVFSRHRALNAASSGNGVLPHAEACLCDTIYECTAYYHSQRALPCQLAESFGKSDDFAKPLPASVALEQMLFDSLLFGICQRSQPIIREDCRINRI